MASPSTADPFFFFSFDVGLADWYKCPGLARRGKINNEGDTGAQCGDEIPGLEGFCLDEDAVDTDPEGFGKGRVTKCQLMCFDGVTCSPASH